MAAGELSNLAVLQDSRKRLEAGFNEFVDCSLFCPVSRGWWAVSFDLPILGHFLVSSQDESKPIYFGSPAYSSSAIVSFHRNLLHAF